MTTLEMMLAHFGGVPMIPLSAAAPFWGCETDTLARKVDTGEVRLPYFRMDESQKATRLIMLTDLSAVVDERHEIARQAFHERWNGGNN